MAAAEAAEADSRPQSAAEQEVEVGSRVDLLPSQIQSCAFCTDVFPANPSRCSGCNGIEVM